MKLSQEFLDKINQHRGILYKAVKIYCDDAEDQKDLMQEMIAQLWLSYEKFQSKSEFSTYMYRVCINTAILSFKKEKRRRGSEQIFYESREKIQRDSDIQRDEVSELHKGIYQLEDIERAIVFLYLEGMSHQQIAENMGIKEGNVRVKFHRIKEKLKSITSQNNQS